MGYEGPECHEPHNLGNPVEVTLLQLVEVVQEVIGKTVQVVHCPLPQDDPHQRQPDISRARRNLDWEPAISLGQGIARTIEDFRLRLATTAPMPGRQSGLGDGGPHEEKGNCSSFPAAEG